MVYSQILILDSSDVFIRENPNINGTYSDFTVKFDKAINLPDNDIYVGLVKASTFYTWNIVSLFNKNSVFKIEKNDGVTITGFVTFLEDGIYDLDSINLKIQESLVDNFGWVYSPNNIPIVLTAEYSTSKFIIEINDPQYSIILNYQLTQIEADLNNSEIFESQFWKLLGWGETQNKTVTVTTKAQKTADITFGINNYLIHCDLITQSVINNNTSSSVLYSYVPDVDIGSSLQIADKHETIYLPINVKQRITNIRIWITDQKERPIEFKEPITVFLHLTDKIK